MCAELRRRPWTRRMRRPRGWRSGAQRAAVPFSRRSPSPAPARGRSPLLPRQSRPAPAPMDWARAPELARPRPRRRGARLPTAGATGLDPDEADEATGEEVRGGGGAGEDEVERGARVCSASAWAAAARKTTRRGRGSSSAHLACPRPGSVGEEGEKGKEARNSRDPPERKKARPPLLLRVPCSSASWCGPRERRGGSSCSPSPSLRRRLWQRRPLLAAVPSSPSSHSSSLARPARLRRRSARHVTAECKTA